MRLIGVCSFMMICWLPLVTEASSRVALLIGNGSYEGSNRLHNPVNDVTDLEAVLKQLAFQVTVVKDATRRQMLEALDRLVQQAVGAEVVLFFYAGHAVQHNGENYLIPLRAHIRGPGDLQFETIHARRIIHRLEAVGTGISIFILDACRDHPYADTWEFRNYIERTGDRTRGLAHMDASPIRGTLIAFSAAPNQTAMYGAGRNSSYVKQLKTYLPQSGLTLTELFNEVGRAVQQETAPFRRQRNEPPQTPSVNFSPLPRVCLAGCQEPSQGAEAVCPSPPKLPQPTRFMLKVLPSPPNAQVRLMNIVPPYHDGISLEPGRYDVEVSHPDHETSRQWIELNKDTVVEVVLKPSGTVATPNPALLPAKSEFQDLFRDGTAGPVMVVIPQGEFIIGSPESEQGREPWQKGNEKQHHVTIDKSFALGKYEVTVGEFRRFVEATGYRTEAEYREGCWAWTGSQWQKEKGFTWKALGFQQADTHPVVCVSWNDAVAYTEWLSEQTGQNYRLPTEAEWEYAARGGTKTARYWGNGVQEACRHASVADLVGARANGWTQHPEHIFMCEDGYIHTAPVGQFTANGFGLYDVLGNVGEWTCSAYDKGYGGAEKVCVDNHQANTSLVLRGGSWLTNPGRVRSATRIWNVPALRLTNVGFRLARSL